MSLTFIGIYTSKIYIFHRSTIQGDIKTKINILLCFLKNIVLGVLRKKYIHMEISLKKKIGDFTKEISVYFQLNIHQGHLLKQ
jgi:hypothetical protein